MLDSQNEEDTFDQKSAEKTANDPSFRIEEQNDNDIMKILIASDIHLGYEQTTKRAQENDSFRTFEEILKCAKDNEVDMILLGGDLFHEAKPPHNVVMECIHLLRKYCLGDRKITIKLLTKGHFEHCKHKIVNYEDPNLNVGTPIFSIHGNHDDPSFGAVGSMDVLATTGLINYFGKWNDVTEISIAPLLIQKGRTKVCLYGMGYMNDRRLSRLMRNDKLKFLPPDVDGVFVSETFNIFVLHQNRAKYSKNSYVPEELLPDFLDFVVWGHEHECLIEPVPSKFVPTMHICQPGSSIATSLTQGESKPKQIGILSVFKDKFKMECIKLKTVRPFVFDNLVLNDCEEEISAYKVRTEAVEEYVRNYIENTMLKKASEQVTGKMQPEKPLIRLRVFYSDERDAFDTLRLTQQFYTGVANPNDMILFRKCGSKTKKKDLENDEQDFGVVGEVFKFDEGEKDWKLTVEDGMTEYFKKDDNVNKLTVLSIDDLNEALSRFVNANDTKVFHELVEDKMKETVEYLLKKNTIYEDENEIVKSIRNYRNEKMLQDEDIAEV